jgi:hypothetical protein
MSVTTTYELPIGITVRIPYGNVIVVQCTYVHTYTIPNGTNGTRVPFLVWYEYQLYARTGTYPCTWWYVRTYYVHVCSTNGTMVRTYVHVYVRTYVRTYHVVHTL